jgi:uncharacterized protein
MTPFTSSRGRVNLLGIGALVALLVGCSTSPPAQFYTLTPEPFVAGDAVASAAFAHPIAVGPVAVPEVVNRPQFVVRDGPNRVTVLEGQRWAEPLKSGIAEAVASYLSRDLNGARVTPMTQSAANDAQFDVALDVQRFEMIVGDAAVIEVVWTIKRRDASAAPMLGRSNVREPAQTSSDPSSNPYDALVAAQVRALASVSRDIAARLAETAN